MSWHRARLCNSCLFFQRNLYFLVYRPVTAPAQRQDNVHREFSLDIDGIEGDDVHHDLTVPTLEEHEGLDDLISAPVHKPYTKYVYAIYDQHTYSHYCFCTLVLFY